MTWQDINKDNIEELKELYSEYLEENKQFNYTNGLLTFEEFVESKVYYCARCGKYELIENLKIDYNSNLLCENCYDELYTI